MQKPNIMILFVFLFLNEIHAQWVQTNGPYDARGIAVYSLVVSGTNLFAGTDGGVFLSTNKGTNWSVVNTGLTKILLSGHLPSVARISLPGLLAAAFGDGYIGGKSLS